MLERRKREGGEERKERRKEIARGRERKGCRKRWRDGGRRIREKIGEEKSEI